MNRIRERFRQLHERGETALMPFITAGDPDLDFTADLIRRLDAAGCHLLELGFPYSDPIADGPVIQASYTRALQADLRVENIFRTVRDVAGQVSMPLVAMVSYSIIYRLGVESFIEQAASAGFAGAIVPDLPIEEAKEFVTLTDQAGLAFSPLVTPMTPPERVAQIVPAASGFVYYVSIVGVTGEQSDFAAELEQQVQAVREHTAAPICIGFGISRPEHASRLARFADGLIVGSAFVKRLAECNETNRDDVQQEVSDFAATLLKAIAGRDASRPEAASSEQMPGR